MSRLNTPICSLLQIEHPVIQAGMPWLCTPQLAAAVSNAGGLGMLTASLFPDAGDDPEEGLRRQLRQVRELTDRPFGLTVFLDDPRARGLVEVALKEGVRVIATAAGSPALLTGRLKEQGVCVLHLVASVRHARAAEQAGVDALVVEGFEGGGVRGADEVPLMALLPQVREAVSLPLIASGGIADARGLVAALALGADGVQVGTRFAATSESVAHKRYKAAILGAVDTSTVVLGRGHYPFRVLRTGGALKALQEAPPNAGRDYWRGVVTAEKVQRAVLEGDLEEGLAPCGMGAGLICDVLPAGDALKRMVQGAAQML